jgi:xanthine dehydrogenase accessory factor
MRREILDRLLAARTAKRPSVLATALSTGEQTLLHPFEGEGGPLAAAAREASLLDRSRIAQGPAGDVFLHVFNPPVRIFLVGAVHIAQSLAPMGALAGYEITVVDPRAAFATPARFPGVALRVAWPDEVLAEVAPDRRTAVVALTHDPKIDDPALQAALRSPAFYVGALGSRKTHGERLARLRAAGFGDADLARIRGPVGLPLGAVSPPEIAVSILAELVQVLRAPVA